MKNSVQLVFLVIYVLCIYVAVPVAVFGGWIRWAKLPKSLTPLSVFSLIGFVLATWSAHIINLD